MVRTLLDLIYRYTQGRCAISLVWVSRVLMLGHRARLSKCADHVVQVATLLRMSARPTQGHSARDAR